MARALYPDGCPWITVEENRSYYIFPQYDGIGMPQTSLEHIFKSVHPSGYSDNVSTLSSQSKYLGEKIRAWVDSGRNQTHNLTTNFDDVKKSQFHSFVSFIKLYFESLKVKIDNFNGPTWGASAIKFHCVFSFDFLSNSFSFDITKSNNDFVQDGVKVKEVVNLSSFSGQIIYDFYINSASFGNINQDLQAKLEFLCDKSKEISDKTEE